MAVKLGLTLIEERLQSMRTGCSEYLDLRQKKQQEAGEDGIMRIFIYNLYTLPDVVRMIKSRSMRWEGHIVCMGEMRNAYSIWIGKPEWKRPLGELGGRIILECILG